MRFWVGVGRSVAGSLAGEVKEDHQVPVRRVECLLHKSRVEVELEV